MSIPTRWLALVVAVFVLAVQSPYAHAGTYVADDQADVFVGTGGLVLPGSVRPDTRQRVAGCNDCLWRLTSPCFAGSSGTAFNGSNGCGSALQQCAGGTRALRAWFAPSQMQWEDLGVACIGEVVTVARAGSVMVERMAHAVPELAVRTWPARGAVAQVPVLVDSGQSPGNISLDQVVGGFPTRLEVQATWRWDWGDGTSTQTSSPGCRYPCADLGHVFQRSGAYRAEVNAMWRGRYWVDGLGPFPVAEAVTQRAGIGIAVGEGRALLSVP